MDCVAASKFLSEDRSKKLIAKLEKFVSIHQRRSFKRQIELSDHVKTTNKSVLYNIDAIHTAISHHKDIQFKYIQYNMKKEQELKEDGRIYRVWPRKLFYDNNLCCVQVSIGKESQILRVDKMMDVQTIEDHDPFSTPQYFAEEEQEICTEKKKEERLRPRITKILFKKEMIDAVIDRFGENVDVELVNDDWFRATVEIVPDSQFFAWIFEFEDRAMIEYPLEVAARMMDLLQDRYKAYREEHSRHIYNYRRKKKPDPKE